MELVDAFDVGEDGRNGVVREEAVLSVCQGNVHLKKLKWW